MDPVSDGRTRTGSNFAMAAGVAAGILTALVASYLVTATLATKQSASASVAGKAREADGVKVAATETAPPPAAPKAPSAPAKSSPATAMRYLDAAWNPIHFKPAIDSATNEQCLGCHQNILDHQVRAVSPAGVEAAKSLGWYQTLDTYEGEQGNFHQRHLTSPFAKQVMNLTCNFCHQGHDGREEAPGSSATTQNPGNFALRKQVDPSQSCLMCHGKFPAEVMGLEGSWSELREAMETPDAPNGCLSCHADQFRTVRHRVNYLKAGAIEDLAKQGSSDSCFGCHGGRAWYRKSYAYPRHPWPGMPDEFPAWAKNRPAQSAPHHLGAAK
jgi:hypothetical protein